MDAGQLSRRDGLALRITGGQLRGRVITGPEGHEVRPTGSKIRQAFFNILSNKVDGARFVDVCAGSGLMGIEALSRGAASLIAIEKSRDLVRAIQSNIKQLGLQATAEIIDADARKGLAVLSPGEADIIFADPPYRSQLLEPIVRLVDECKLLSPDGILAMEHANELKLLEETDALVLYDRRKYGQTAVSFYRLK